MDLLKALLGRTSELKPEDARLTDSNSEASVETLTLNLVFDLSSERDKQKFPRIKGQLNGAERYIKQKIVREHNGKLDKELTKQNYPNDFYDVTITQNNKTATITFLASHKAMESIVEMLLYTRKYTVEDFRDLPETLQQHAQIITDQIAAPPACDR